MTIDGHYSGRRPSLLPLPIKPTQSPCSCPFPLSRTPTPSPHLHLRCHPWSLAAAPVFCRHRNPTASLHPHLSENLLVVPYISSTPCATHPSPLMPRSPAIWLTRAPPSVAPLQKSGYPLRLQRWWAHHRDPIDLLSVFCISLEPLVARNPADSKLQGRFMSVTSFCPSQSLDVEEDKVVLWRGSWTLL
jgi:hypothetical protein